MDSAFQHLLKKFRSRPLILAVGAFIKMRYMLRAAGSSQERPGAARSSKDPGQKSRVLLGSMLRVVKLLGGMKHSSPRRATRATRARLASRASPSLASQPAEPAEPAEAAEPRASPLPASQACQARPQGPGSARAHCPEQGAPAPWVAPWPAPEVRNWSSF